MRKLNSIQVNRVDNRLLILATTWTSSTQLKGIAGGNYQANMERIDLSQLADGEYDFTLIGINAGGDFAFDVDLNVDGNVTKIGAVRTTPTNRSISYDAKLQRLTLPKNTNRVVWTYTFKANVKK